MFYSKYSILKNASLISFRGKQYLFDGNKIFLLRFFKSIRKVSYSLLIEMNLYYSSKETVKYMIKEWYHKILISLRSHLNVWLWNLNRNWICLQHNTYLEGLVNYNVLINKYLLYCQIVLKYTFTCEHFSWSYSLWSQPGAL